MKGLSEHRVFKTTPLFCMYVRGRKCGVYRGTLVCLPLHVCVSRQNFPSEMDLVALVQLLKVAKQGALLDHTD